MRFAILLATLTLSFAVHAEAVGICGKVDFATITNTDLENLLALNDAADGKPTQRIQCGLPGEKLALCQACAPTTDENSMRVLRPILADHGHLTWHASWHNIRKTTDLSGAEFKKAQANGFIPKDISFQDFTAKHLIGGGTLAGEDFFYMHRLMIKMVQLELGAHHLDCFAPWTEVPALDDAAWPVPHKDADSEYTLVQKQLAKLRNPVLLKKVSLNRLGELVEPNLHQNLHHLYQSSPVCSSEAKAQGYCDDLIPVETSPLNKHFWKLHGLIDGLLGEWLKANGYDEISLKCDNRPNCYPWGKVWISARPS